MTNFPTHTNPKGTHVNREQKAHRKSTPNTGLAATLSNVFRVQGTSAPSTTPSAQGPVRPHIKLLALLAISLLTSLAFASSASAAPAAAHMETISDVSYTSAQVTGKVSGDFVVTTYTFEYSKDPQGEGWTPGPSANFGLSGPIADKPAAGKIEGLEGGTKYFVRLHVSSEAEADSPAAPPYPSFTTLTADPPTIPGVVGASGVFSTSATGTAEVNRPAASDKVECHFEYVTDAEFTGNPPGDEFAGAIVRPCIENPIEDTGTKGVSGPLGCTAPLTDPPESCLKPETTYHLRLVAENAAPGVVTKEATNTFTTAAAVAKPTVIDANDASDVSYSTAKVSGKVQRPAGADPALDTSCRFEYVTDEQFNDNPPGEEFAGAGQAECVEAPSYAPLTGIDPTPVTAELTGLPLSTTGTTYHLRLTAVNGGGTTSKDANTFETTPSVEPTFEIHPLSPADIGYTQVQATATIDAGTPDHPLNFQFQLSTDPAQGWPIGENGFVHNSEPGIHDYVSLIDPQGNGLQRLKPGTTYYVRIRGNDGFLGTEFVSPEPYESFTTKGTTDPPLASCDPVTTFTATTAHISCAVDPNAPAGPLPDEAKAIYNTKWRIECTPDCADVNGNEIGGIIDAEAGSQSVTGDLARLDPNKDYVVKLIATNGLGTVESVQPFHTLKSPPSVKQASGASDGTGGYTLQGVVNPNNETITDCDFRWGPSSNDLVFSADCSPLLPNPGAKPTTVEAHLTDLTADVDYYSQLVVKYGTGLEEDSGDPQVFKATITAKDPCANEQLRLENNSLALPECRAYEMVTPPGKEGFGVTFRTYGGGDRVAYSSEATNLAKSGQNLGLDLNRYVAARTESGWETIPNLNGSSGSLYDAPSFVNPDTAGPVFRAYSSDLLSSVWALPKTEPDNLRFHQYLRAPDGTFTLISPRGSNVGYNGTGLAPSADLSHLITWKSEWGPGVYEFLGTGNAQPRRVDLDNSGALISTCEEGVEGNAANRFISADGSRIVNYVYGGCGGANPPANEIWARVDGTTSYDVSASHCDRTAADPAGACNGPVGSGGCVNSANGESGPGCRVTRFQAAAKDGSRVFFTTTQQLVDEDIDQTNDIYACDIPSGNPAPTPDKANHCSAFRQVSGAQTGAAVESVDATSENGATVLFTAKGVLASNEDALKEKAVAGDHNLYAWRTDASHPDGQTAFVARLDSNDLSAGNGQVAQATPDGRYLVFTTTSQLLETDTDSARDVYRYDADTGVLTRVSTNVFGVAGNGDFEALTGGPREHHPTTTVSDDGTKIVFTTEEPLNLAVDGNAEPDVYLWTPARVSLISTGSSGSAPRDKGDNIGSPGVAIAPSGEDIYFTTAQPLTPADPDDSTDVYNARIGGGFSFAPKPVCMGEACQPPVSSPPAASAAPANRPKPDDNVVPKTCPKGKVLKGNKCVKKKHKKHSGKKHHGKKPGHKQGGGK